MAQFHETIMGRQFYESTVPSIAKSLEIIASKMVAEEPDANKKEEHYRKLLSSVVDEVSVNTKVSEQVDTLRKYGFTTEDLKEFGYSDEDISEQEEEDHPHVIMEFKLQILDEDKNVMDPHDAEELSFGGYCFIVNGKEISFDWDACSADFEGNTVSGCTGYGPFFNEFQLANYYDEELAELGLSRHDLTAKFLASCEEIEEFYCEAGDVILESITFFDDEGNKFKVNKNVLEAFNLKVLQA